MLLGLVLVDHLLEGITRGKFNVSSHSERPFMEVFEHEDHLTRV
jgi:hypothetical protein